MTPPAWDPLGAAPFAWDLPEPGPVPAPAPQRRSRVTPVTLALAGHHGPLDGRRLLPHEDPQKPVGDDAGAADGHQRDERGAHPQDVRAEMIRNAAGHARDEAPGPAAVQRPGRRDRRGGVAHEPIVTRTPARAIGVEKPISQGDP